LVLGIVHCPVSRILFVANKVAMAQVPTRGLGFFLPNIIPTVLHTPAHSLNKYAVWSRSVFPQRCFAETQGPWGVNIPQKIALKYATTIRLLTSLETGFYFYLRVLISFKYFWLVAITEQRIFIWCSYSIML
jgi:hypothetical protein